MDSDFNVNLNKMIKIDFIGNGGFGKVIRVYYLDDNLFYARKSFSSMESFQREVWIYDKYFKNDKILKYIAEQKFHICDGKKLWIFYKCGLTSLDHYINIMKSGKPFQKQTLDLMILMLLTGLHELHKKKVIHKDIKLANIAVFPTNEIDPINTESMTLKFIDIGEIEEINENDKTFKRHAYSYIPKNFAKNYNKNGDYSKLLKDIRSLDYYALGKVFEILLRHSEIKSEEKETDYKFVNDMGNEDEDIRLSINLENLINIRKNPMSNNEFAIPFDKTIRENLYYMNFIKDHAHMLLCLEKGQIQGLKLNYKIEKADQLYQKKLIIEANNKIKKIQTYLHNNPLPTENIYNKLLEINIDHLEIQIETELLGFYLPQENFNLLEPHFLSGKKLERKKAENFFQEIPGKK